MPIEVILPKVDMDMSSGTISDWHSNEGEQVQTGEALFDIETDKAVMEIESPATGTLHFVTGQKGDVVPIGQVIAWIFKEGEPVVAPAENEKHTTVEPNETHTPKVAIISPSDPAPSPTKITGIRATPLARRLAKAAGIDLNQITGSGPRGRITRSDIDNAPQSQPTSLNAGTGAQQTADDLGIGYSIVPVDKMRAIIAKRLTISKSTVPHFYLNADINIDALLALRVQINQAMAETLPKKISVTDLLIKACALALKDVPKANASWDGNQIIQYDDANISVAVSVDGGLMTPVVRAAQSKNIRTISAEIGDLADRAKSRKLAREEYQGGSFSISNLGMFGVKSFNAIINPPESMILAVGKGTAQFIPDEDGNPKLATIMGVTLSCDHRVVDGALGAVWLQKFTAFVENPLTLIIT